jgi:NAD(P)H-hydrate epimerase
MSREQIQKADQVTITQQGIPGIVLMENAGKGAAEYIMSLLPERGASCSIVCGSGNNGGDGYVIARYLINKNIKVKVYLLTEKFRIKGDAKTNLEILQKMSADIIEVSEQGLGSYLEALNQSKIVVDAIFGTGLKSEVKGKYKEAIEVLNRCQSIKVAVDVPSGLDVDTGWPLGVCVKVDHTVTFGYLKSGLLLYPGASLAGKIHLVDIGFSPHIPEMVGFEGIVLSLESLKHLIPPRAPDAHKGNFGHLGIIAGSVGKPGAALMCAKAALRSGTGLVTLLSSLECQKILAGKVQEVMYDHFIERDDSEPTFEAKAKLRELIDKKSALVIGPGIPTSPGISSLLLEIIKDLSLPMVIDADGLNLIARHSLDILKEVPGDLVLTPHPGEMARLIKTSVAEIQARRIKQARDFAKEYKLVLVLKGVPTVIATSEGEIFLNSSGNPGMASGGTGDVLTGMIAAFLAQGYPPLDAAKLGVYLHGLCGDLARDKKGEISLIAGDLIEELPVCFRRLTNGR